VNDSKSRPVRILLVEDNPLDVKLTKEMLKEAKIGNEVEVAEDGQVALDRLGELYSRGPDALPDLVLLDLNLPKIDGRKLLALMKADERFKNIPVAVLTASSKDEDVLASYNLKAVCFVTKPVDVSQMLKVVECVDDFGLSIVLKNRA
jgi:chemotaxis family two-component system response regulator Rcp1